MARVPDMFEELNPCNSENEGFILDTDQVSLSQESFYPSASPYHKENWTKVEISEQTHHLNLQEYAGETVVQREIEKKRQLSRSHPITNDYLVNVGSIPEENKDVIKYRLDSTIQNNVVYEFHSFITDQKVMDQKYRNLIPRENTLRAIAIQNATREVTFDIGRYITLSPAPNNGIAVTLKLSNTNLYVTAKKENEPIQLQEIPTTPTKLDGSQSPVLFYWTEHYTYSTFASVVNPELFLATQNDDFEPVIMATGMPALLHFIVSEE
ncbi:interleukin-1 alpha-like [Vombatus ursinus]|uniref:interleukin-1 alpha-like n=1 Tax=Vombatus ursinus TaxID=29139 RepID=UPI000FFD99B6|nr:interleukin-1 alpha-like [Vombatus ursinus]